MIKRCVFAALFAASLSAPAFAEPFVIEADMIEGFKRTAFKVPGFEQAEDETRLAFAAGVCAHIISPSQSSRYRARLSATPDAKLRSMLLDILDEGKRKGPKMVKGKSIVVPSPHVCDEILAYSELMVAQPN